MSNPTCSTGHAGTTLNGGALPGTMSAAEEHRDLLERLTPIIDAAQGDPIFGALAAWRDARQAELLAVEEHGRFEAAEDYREGDEAERFAAETLDPAHTRASEAYERLACARAATPAGVIAQLCIAEVIEREHAPQGRQAIGDLLTNAAAGIALLGGHSGRAAAESDDPAVVAYRRWASARKAELEFHRTGQLSSELEAAERAESEAAVALARTVPISPLGLALQLRFAFLAFGELKPKCYGTAPRDYEVHDTWADERGSALLHSMLAGAERLAGDMS